MQRTKKSGSNNRSKKTANTSQRRDTKETFSTQAKPTKPFKAEKNKSIKPLRTEKSRPVKPSKTEVARSVRTTQIEITRSKEIKKDISLDNLENQAPREGVFGGRRAVLEALKSDRTINKIFILNGEREGSIKEIVGIAKEKRIPVVFIDKNKMHDLVDDYKHQGVAASVPPVDYVDLDEIINKKSENNIIIILDGIEDPHNLGAIIRTAEVVGAKGVVIPKRRGVLLTETVAKASAGAVVHLPVAKVANLVQTVKYLKEKGYWITGADMDGNNLWKENLKQPVALVIGNEGKGISRLLKEHCDFLASIPVYGKVSSLNASVATGILLYEIARQSQG